jgi:hypothetical protein
VDLALTRPFEEARLACTCATVGITRSFAEEEIEIPELAPKQGLPAVKVRPSGFEPETCGVGFRCSHTFAGVRNCALTLDLPFARVRRRSQASAPRGSPFGSPKSCKVTFGELWKALKEHMGYPRSTVMVPHGFGVRSQGQESFRSRIMGHPSDCRFVMSAVT